MTEIISQETAQPGEVVAGKYNIHFEPGVHPFPLTDVILGHPTVEQIRNKFVAGDLTAHAWNPQIARRMRQYSPYVLGLDSVNGLNAWSETPIAWPWLPGSPKEMSGRDTIYVVGGDILHHQFIPTKEANQAGWDKVADYTKNILGVEAVGGHILLPVSLMILLSRLEKRVSRRNFLRLGAGVGALSLAAFLGKLMPLMQSYSPTPSTEDLSQIINKINKPLTKSIWLEGRTALVISKTMDAMKELNLPQGANGSVVMGFPHAYEVGDLLTDKHARMEAIKKYAQEFFEDLYGQANKYFWEYALKQGAIRSINDEEGKKAYFMDQVLSEFVATSVYAIKEPSFYHTDNPKQTVADLTEFTTWFGSPEVMEAVSPLGNPEKFVQETKDILQETKTNLGLFSNKK